MFSFNQRECLGCGQPCDGLYCYLCTCQQCEVSLTNGICLNCTYRDGKPLICCKCEVPLRGGFCWFCDSRDETSFAYDPNLNSFDDSQNLSDYPPQPQYETYLCELCGNDSHYGYDFPSRFPLVYERKPSYNQNYNDNYYPHNSPSFLCCDNYEFIKSSVEDLVPIPNESEYTSGSDSECILPSCDDFSPIDIPKEKVMTFSNPLFNLNDDFTSSGDESLSDEDVPEDNVKIYSNTLFEFEDEYISNDVNPLFDKVLENIESKDSYDFNLDEPHLLVTPLFDANKNECFDSGGDDDEINVLDYEDSYYDSKGDILYLESFLNDDLVHHDPSIPAMSVASILEGLTDKPPLEENDELLYLEPKNDGWKKILYDAPILMTEDKVFDPGIHDQNFSPTYVRLPFEDRHYLFFTYVV
nr:hypothetical protein [Tanacetum cinerariifolium]